MFRSSKKILSHVPAVLDLNWIGWSDVPSAIKVRHAEGVVTVELDGRTGLDCQGVPGRDTDIVGNQIGLVIGPSLGGQRPGLVHHAGLSIDRKIEGVRITAGVGDSRVNGMGWL